MYQDHSWPGQINHRSLVISEDSLPWLCRQNQHRDNMLLFIVCQVLLPAVNPDGGTNPQTPQRKMKKRNSNFPKELNQLWKE